MTYFKEDIINEYKKLKRRIGSPPDSRTFYSETGISRHAAEVAFGREAFSKIQREAGDNPYAFGIPGRTPDQFFLVYGQVVRELQSIPTRADWKHRRISPTADSYCRKLHLPWRAMPSAFLEWANDKPEWQDVARICDSRCTTENKRTDEAVPEDSGYVYLLRAGKFYKIGRTNSLGRREYEVALQLPEKAKTIHFIQTDDPVGIEAYWHKRFENKRKRGEWFELSSEDVRAFKRRKSM